MGLILVCIAIIIIAPIIAFIALVLQFLIAGIPISDIWRKREGRFNLLPAIYPSLSEYEKRLNPENLANWCFAGQEFIEIISNPDNKDLLRRLVSDESKHLFSSAMKSAELLKKYPDEKISATAEKLIRMIETVKNDPENYDRKVLETEIEKPTEVLRALQKLAEYSRPILASLI